MTTTDATTPDLTARAQIAVHLHANRAPGTHDRRAWSACQTCWDDAALVLGQLANAGITLQLQLPTATETEEGGEAIKRPLGGTLHEERGPSAGALDATAESEGTPAGAPLGPASDLNQGQERDWPEAARVLHAYVTGSNLALSAGAVGGHSELVYAAQAGAEACEQVERFQQQRDDWARFASECASECASEVNQLGDERRQVQRQVRELLAEREHARDLAAHFESQAAHLQEALDHCHAEAATLREALAVLTVCDHDQVLDCPDCEPVPGIVRKALASDAGAAVLAQLRTADAVVSEIEAWYALPYQAPELGEYEARVLDAVAAFKATKAKVATP